MAEISSKLNNKFQLSALIMAGGTGGHIFPGLAIANQLKINGWSVDWLGSVGGMEENIVSNHDIPLHLISISGLRGKGKLGWIKAPITLIKAVFQSLKVIRKIQPRVVIGFGGFVSGPAGIAAFLLRIPLLIHEQNAVAGLTNKMLAKIATYCFQAFPNTLKGIKNCQTIGNPIRKEIVSLNEAERVVDEKAINTVNVLVVGGSRGAMAFNQDLAKILLDFWDEKKVNVRHQCGKGNLNATESVYATKKRRSCQESKNEQRQHLSNELPQGLAVEEFIDDIAEAYSWADLVICRAGALTVSEIAVAGLAAIFIPYPYAVDDHQTKNANWLVEQEAGILIQQVDLLSEASREKIVALIDNPVAIKKIADKAKSFAYLNATEIMSENCELLAKEAA